MRILVVMLVRDAIGGAERYVETLATGLAQAGCEVHVAILQALEPSGLENLSSRLVDAGVTVHRSRAVSRRAVRRLVGRVKPALVHWNFTSPFSFGAGGWLLGHWGVPQVITEHLPAIEVGPRWTLTRALSNRAIDACIVVAPSAASVVNSRWRRPPRVCVVLNGVVLGEHRQRAQTKAMRLVVVGRLEHQKNVELVLDAVASVRSAGRNVRLAIVGAGTLESQLRARSSELELSDHVEFLGFVDTPTPHLLSADIFVSAAKFEGYPLAPMEALVTGAPVALSDIPAHNDLAKINRGVVIVRGWDAESWSRSIELALDEVDVLSASAVADRDALSRDRMVTRTMGVYRSSITPMPEAR